MTEVQCSRDGCDASRTGKCLEGFEPLPTCPFLVQSDLEEAEGERGEQTSLISLPSGDVLDEIEACGVTRREPTRVVVLAGPVASGKTTILTSLYTAFLEAPFANFVFSGSQTLVGFERRSHDLPENKRTPIKNTVEFLHLRVTPSLTQDFQTTSILLSDISGERFHSLRDSTEAVRRMPALRRADYFTVVMDGGKLSDPAQRHLVRNDIRMLVRSVWESGILDAACRIDLVISKWDLVLTSPDAEGVQVAIQETKESLNTILRGSVPLRVHEVAAYPRSRRLPFAHGLASLFSSWLERPPLPMRPVFYPSSLGSGNREITRFFHSEMSASGLNEVYDVRSV